MELDYRLEADNQRAFAKAYDGDPHSRPAHRRQRAQGGGPEWIEGIPMSQIIRDGTHEQRDLMGTRLFELTYDAPRRLEMMHGDAHPGNFMLLPDDKMGVIDFGAVAPMPGGIPIELGLTVRYALDEGLRQVAAHDGEDRLHPEGRAGVDPRDRRHAAPVRRTARGRGIPLHPQVAAEDGRGEHGPLGRAIRTARQMDIPAKLAIPMRVIASNVAISCQLDAHIPTKALASELIPGFADEAGLSPGEDPAALRGCRISSVFLRGRPRGRLRATIVPRSMISPPQTPHGSSRSSAAARHWRRIGQSAHNALARSRSTGLSANHRSGSPT